ncbi:hypothetical protein ACEPAH_3184 [Sanghuangporus vaninii]
MSASAISVGADGLAFDDSHPLQSYVENTDGPAQPRSPRTPPPRVPKHDSMSDLDQGDPTVSSSPFPVSPTAILYKLRKYAKPTSYHPVIFPKDTPVARSRNGQAGAFLPNKSEDVADDHAKLGKKTMIGPMPLKQFLNDFLPPVSEDNSMPDPSGAFDDVPLKPRHESDIYEPLINAINEGKRCPSVQFCITADIPEGSGRGALKPDFCGYDHKDVPYVTRRVETKKEGSKIVVIKYATNLGLAGIFGEIKKDKDPICEPSGHVHRPNASSIYKSYFACENHKYDPPNEPESAVQERRNLGQNISYASDACSRQHRMFYFSILVVLTRARIFRWDRAGSIVTVSFDYREHPELLCEFLWRFHLANPVQRGFDPTVIVALEAEEELFRNIVRKHVAFQLAIDEDNSKELDEALQLHYEPGKVTKIIVHDPKNLAQPREFLVSVPLESPRSVVGHCTRAYWSVEITAPGEGKVCFLKDTWRVKLDEVVEEEIAYNGMKEAEVENICDLDAYENVPNLKLLPRCDTSDANARVQNLTAGKNASEAEVVESQCTRTNEYINKSVVLKQAGYPLSTFKGSQELFGGAKDALEALNSAYSQCGRIHRNISMGNIVLYRYDSLQPRRGLVVDWEFSTLENRLSKAAEYFRSLTWAFVSGRVLKGRGYLRQTIDDDMESLFYVVMYGCIRWLPHNDVPKLGKWMYNFFDVADEDEKGRAFGGREKCAVQIQKGQDFLETFSFPNKKIQDFFEIGYRLLATIHPDSVEKGEKKLWTMKMVQHLFRSIHGGLLSIDDTAHDRVENKVNDFFISTKNTRHGTHTPLTSVDGMHNPGRGLLQSDKKGTSGKARKRPIHPNCTPSQLTSGKRRRLHLDDQRPSFPVGESSTTRVTRSAANIRRSARNNSVHYDAATEEGENGTRSCDTRRKSRRLQEKAGKNTK